jgi:hypothetical protein
MATVLAQVKYEEITDEGLVITTTDKCEADP